MTNFLLLEYNMCADYKMLPEFKLNAGTYFLVIHYKKYGNIIGYNLKNQFPIQEAGIDSQPLYQLKTIHGSYLFTHYLADSFIISRLFSTMHHL